MDDENKNLDWLDEIEGLAEDILSQQETSACEQVHPIVEKWYREKMEGEPPVSRDSVMQAMACLTTEIMADIPENIFRVLSEQVDEDEVAYWLQEVLLIGRSFEQALHNGELDDL